MRSWNLKSKSHTPLDCIAQMVNPILRGWANYYGKYGGKSFQKLLRYFDLLLAKWAKAKYKTFRQQAHVRNIEMAWEHCRKGCYFLSIGK